jgi:hypothetical protein
MVQVPVMVARPPPVVVLMLVVRGRPWNLGARAPRAEVRSTLDDSLGGLCRLLGLRREALLPAFRRPFMVGATTVALRGTSLLSAPTIRSACAAGAPSTPPATASGRAARHLRLRRHLQAVLWWMLRRRHRRQLWLLLALDAPGGTWPVVPKGRPHPVPV